MWIDTCKAQRTEIQGLNERLNNSDRVVFCDEIIKPLGKQSALISVGTLNETLHAHLTQKLQRKYIDRRVFTQPGYRAAVIRKPSDRQQWMATSI